MRTNKAQDWLLRLETQLRAFIDEQMTQAFGTDWPKSRLPNGLYEEWQEKKRKALKAGGEDRPLIAYADFTDYERVICRSDNWREIFARFFGRCESVRETFKDCIRSVWTRRTRDSSHKTTSCCYTSRRGVW